ncbi:uncharacterized protein DS421_15g511070 [Arachis hypogaea]|nr:uncharacterized protein DS421_15g511070 [Arachis hypogaea]
MPYATLWPLRSSLSKTTPNLERSCIISHLTSAPSTSAWSDLQKVLALTLHSWHFFIISTFSVLNRVHHASVSKKIHSEKKKARAFHEMQAKVEKEMDSV